MRVKAGVFARVGGRYAGRKSHGGAGRAGILRGKKAGVIPASACLKSFLQGFSLCAPPKGHVPWEFLTPQAPCSRALAETGAQGRYGPKRRFGGGASDGLH